MVFLGSHARKSGIYFNLVVTNRHIYTLNWDPVSKVIPIFPPKTPNLFLYYSNFFTFIQPIYLYNYLFMRKYK